MAGRPWRPPGRIQIGLFHASHPRHGVRREERPYDANVIYEASRVGLENLWKPGAVFVVLACPRCRSHLVIDIVGGPTS